MLRDDVDRSLLALDVAVNDERTASYGNLDESTSQLAETALTGRERLYKTDSLVPPRRFELRFPP